MNTKLKVFLRGLISFLFLSFAHCFPDRCTRNQIGEESNSLHNRQILPPCVGPIERQMEGRFRSGVADDSYEMTSAPWLNATLATIGQQFVAKNWFGMNMGMIMTELMVGAIPDLTHAMWPTGSVDNAMKSVRRFTANILQGGVWCKEDMFGPKSNIFESTNHIRSMHLTNIHKHPPNGDRHRRTKTYQIDEEVWGAFDRDLKDSNIPAYRRVIPPGGKDPTDYYLNQFGVTATLWAAAAMPIIRSQQFGVPIGSDDELEGLLHLCAFVGHGLGIEDQFNICLQPNIKEARIYFERFLNELLVPFVFDMEYESKVMMEVAAKGYTETIGPIAQFDFILRRMLEDVVGIPVTNLNAKMSPMGRTLDTFYRLVLRPGVRMSRTLRSLTNHIYEGYVQNLTKKVFGLQQPWNQTLVAQKAFSW